MVHKGVISDKLAKEAQKWMEEFTPGGMGHSEEIIT